MIVDGVWFWIMVAGYAIHLYSFVKRKLREHNAKP